MAVSKPGMFAILQVLQAKNAPTAHSSPPATDRAQQNTSARFGTARQNGMQAAWPAPSGDLNRRTLANKRDASVTASQQCSAAIIRLNRDIASAGTPAASKTAAVKLAGAVPGAVTTRPDDTAAALAR